jgi:uncharacterized protein YbjT (DUF2867 family)
MKIVVMGGTGLIGTKVVNKLRAKGHEVLAASPTTGVNTITGEGLAQAISGAHVIVDVSNSPSFEDKAALDFFTASGRNLLAAEMAAGTKHHVALSIVGLERHPESGYFRAKLAQEALIQSSKIPYTIIRSTQFFEFLEKIVQSNADGLAIHLSPAAFQPIYSDDVATILTDIALGAPLNGTIEIAGPERASLAEFGQKYLAERQDSHKLVIDPKAPYFGIVLNDQSLVPSGNAKIGRTHFAEWLSPGLSNKAS